VAVRFFGVPNDFLHVTPASLATSSRPGGGAADLFGLALGEARTGSPARHTPTARCREYGLGEAGA